MKKILMIILDGFGHREEEFGNAIKEANMEYFNTLWEKYPHSILNASGDCVGLPDNLFGNSEVCHEAIGIGKKIKQDITIANEKINEVSKLMKNASFEEKVEVEKAILQILREYKKLLENQIISDSDYITKKVVLLNCVIK